MEQELTEIDKSDILLDWYRKRAGATPLSYSKSLTHLDYTFSAEERNRLIKVFIEEGILNLNYNLDGYNSVDLTPYGFYCKSFLEQAEDLIKEREKQEKIEELIEKERLSTIRANDSTIDANEKMKSFLLFQKGSIYATVGVGALTLFALVIQVYYQITEPKNSENKQELKQIQTNIHSIKDTIQSLSHKIDSASKKIKSIQNYQESKK